HQEIALVPTLSVLENVFLAARPTGALQRRALRRRLQTLMHQTGFVVSQVDAPVSSLRIAEQQKVEILRALVRGADMIVMDERPAALSDDEAERLYALIRSLRDQGTSVVYISHYLEEVLALADTVSVLKDGQLVRSAPASGETPETLIAAMLGRSLEATFPDKTLPAADAPVVLSVTGLTRPGVIGDVSFAIREGEIVGLAGLVGSGRTELARAIFGADRYASGRIAVHGRPARIRSPRGAIKRQIALLPESRKEQGLMMTR